jgi:hypothetical protein
MDKLQIEKELEELIELINVLSAQLESARMLLFEKYEQCKKLNL